MPCGPTRRQRAKLPFGARTWYKTNVHRGNALVAPWLSGALWLALAGCGLDVRDLDAFRETARGPEKLHAIVRDPSRTGALRGEAALRLLALERSDVDGGVLLFDALTTLAAESRQQLLPTLERGLLARMRTQPGAVPSGSAVHAKDTAVELLALLDPRAREELGGAVLQWMGEDLALRADAGRFSLEAVAARVGNTSAKASAETLRPGLSAKTFSRLTDTIERHAAASVRELAAEKVVAIELACRSAPVPEPALLAQALTVLGRFVDTQSARTRLVAIAADAGLPVAQRERAFDLLAQQTTPEDVGSLAAVALAESEPLRLRELALQRLGETGAKEALPTLLALAGNRALRSLRQPAVERAIELGGERTLATLFKTLPSHWNVTYAKSELDAYSARVERLPPTGYLVALLGGKLYSVFWWNRVIAIRYLAHRANPMDATWRLRLHVDDKQEIVGEGWPPNWTVGREVSAALREVTAR